MPPKKRKVPLSRDANDACKAICHAGGISNKSLEELLEVLRDHPELLEATHHEVQDEFHARWKRLSTTIPLELVGGGTWDWPVVDPGLLLQSLLAENPNIFSLFAESMINAPCTQERPWHTLVGFDEFAPGDKLKVDNRRKCMVLDFTFTELGGHNLSRDGVWMTPVVVRHSMIEQVIGGWSRMLRDFLRLLFFGPHGLSTVGVAVTVGGETLVFWCCMGRLLSDGDGIRLALDWKGAAGLKPCFRHHNVVSKTSGLQSDIYVDICCADFRRFDLWEPDVLDATIDMLTEAKLRVERGAMTAARLEKLEKAAGYIANPYGLMAGVELRSHFRAGSVTTFD